MSNTNNNRPNNQSGGIMLKGVRTHESKKKPNPRKDRKRWNNSRNNWE